MKRALAALALLAAASVTDPGVAGGAPPPDNGCNRRSVKALVLDYIEAYNDGDLERLDRLFADEPGFYEYTVTPIERWYPTAFDRSTLLEYFEDRNAHKDYFTLLALRTGPQKPSGFWINGVYQRTSEDPSPFSEGRFQQGKSGTTPGCRQILLWRIGWSELPALAGPHDYRS